jgi:hypothetical protein
LLKNDQKHRIFAVLVIPQHGCGEKYRHPERSAAKSNNLSLFFGTARRHWEK